MSLDKTAGSKTFLVWGLLILLMVGGAFLRFYNLGEKSLWSDEIATIASALGNSVDPVAYELRGDSYDPPSPRPAQYYKIKLTRFEREFDFAKTAEVLRRNVHPPFFFWLANAQIHLLDYQPVSLRLLPALFGVLCIPMLFLLGRRLGGAPLGLLAAAILSISTYQVNHAQDARQYTLLLLLAITSAWLMLRLMDARQNRPLEWLGLTLLSAIGLYTQYLYSLFLVFLYGYALISKRREPGFLKGLICSGVGVLALFTPWLPFFQAQLGFLKAAGHYTSSSGLWNPLQLPEKLWRNLNEFVMPETWGKILPLAVFGLALFGTWLRHRREKLWLWPISRPAVLSLLWITVILAGQILLDLAQQGNTVTIRRYTLLASPAYYLLLAWAMLGLKSHLPGLRISLRTLMIPLYLGLTLFYTVQSLTVEPHSSDEFKQAAAWINREFQPGDVVLVNKSGAMTAGMSYYLKPTILVQGLQAASSPDFPNKPAALAQLRNATSRKRNISGRVWAVYSHTARSTMAKLDRWLVKQGYQKRKALKVPGVQVMLYCQS